MRRVAVIGAGIGGLALAIRLQSAGLDTTLIEARDTPGGQAGLREQDGFTFDTGPGAIPDAQSFAELWRLSGHDIAEDVRLLPVTPFCRFSWPDGTAFDLSADSTRLGAEIARIEPEDAAGFRRFLDYAATAARETARLDGAPLLDWRAMLRGAPALLRHQAWRSLHAKASAYVKNDKLAQALSFVTLAAGGNPTRASAFYAAAHKLLQDGGLWWPEGGTNRLVAAMVRHFERLGGVVRLGDPVTAIDTLGERATGVRTAGGFEIAVDAVASNADAVHSYRDLLAGSRSAQRRAAALVGKRFAPSLFRVHFGVRGSFPDVPHHSVLFGPRYEGLLDDIFEHGLLSEDMLVYLHHPSATDRSVAPEGHSTFHALAFVPHLGKFPADWEALRPILEQRLLDEVERRVLPGLKDQIVTSFSYAPPDFARDFHAHLGSPFGLEPVRSQSAWLRVRNRDDAIGNLYFVGAATHPGAGIPGVLASARATAALMLEEAR